MDNFLYEQTLEDDVSVNQMVDKEVLHVLDQNGGSYNGQITFDCSPLANSGKWLSYREGYLQVPFVMTYKSDADSTAANVVNGFYAGLKNGSHHIIDSIQVDYNNTNVVQLQPFTNFYVSYKLMTSFSEDDVKKHGPTIGFNPDSAESYSFSAGAARNGDGYANNAVNKDLAIAYRNSLGNCNEGYLDRLRNTAYPLTTRDTGINSLPQIATTALANQIGMNYVQDNAGAGAARVWQWNILATIRLKDVSDFFDKMPLVRGATLRLIVNYNSFTNTITSASAANPTLVLAANGVVANSGRTNPMMVSSAAASNPLVTILDGANTFSCGVATCANKFASASLPSCRLYVPAYELNPAYESQLLQLRKTSEIVYTDIYNYNISNVSAGASFNQILTNGIVNPKMLVVMPYANTSAGVYANVTTPVWQSPFDSAPATTSPLCALTQFNVQVSGRNLFQQNFQYDFEAFINEMQSANAINGGADTGLTCGLLGQKEWSLAYRYYVADLSRRLPADDNIPKSITIQGTNNSGVALDLVCFIAFERRIRLDMSTGAIIS
jgi:hypothetical protein